MIFPVPEGVDPNSHRCGECQGRFTMPWNRELGGHLLICVTDPDHQTYQKKYTGTRMMYNSKTQKHDLEVDILTQREVTELAPITDESTALAAVTKANALGLFPSKDSTPDQLALLSHVALLYRLDPNMGEIIPYQGKPYITIAGRRRLDAAAGNNVSIRFRPLSTEERQDYVDAGALHTRDVAGFCVGTNPKTGVTVEGFGRVLHSEGMGRDGKASEHLPQGVRRIEMQQKRAERRMREMMFGPTPVPEGLRAVEMLQEGDEINVVESTGKVVEESTTSPLPDLGTCPEHGVEWRVEERYKRIVGSHPIQGGGWCKFDTIYWERFRGAWKAKYGDESSKAEVDAWLKANFNGKTWSKMDAPEMIEALTLLTTLPAATETPAEPPPEGNGAEPLPDPEIPPETSYNAEGRITQYQVNALLTLCAEDVPLMDLMVQVKEQTGESFLGNIQVTDYDGIVAWVNQQIDQKVVEVQEH